MFMRKIFDNDFITLRENSIYIEEIPLSSLCSTQKTPFYVFSKNRIIQNINSINEVIKSFDFDFQLYYSVKSNYIPEILKIIYETNTNFEIISDYELNLLEKYNLSKNEMLIGGPYLSEDLILKGFSIKNPYFIVYSLNQLKEIERIAELKNIDNVKIILRFISQKLNAHLGIPADDFFYITLKRELDNLKRIKIVGILSHYGTQINSFEIYNKNLVYLLNIAENLKKYLNIQVNIINLGGGLPIASSFKKEQLYKIFKLINETVIKGSYEHIKFIFELGRYIVGDAGGCVMKIIDIYKKDNKSNQIYVNGGSHILPKFAKNPMRFYNLNHDIEHYNFPVDIYGIIPSEEDILAKNYNFTEKSKIGDYVLATNCGAYAHTFSTRFPYNEPEIIIVNNNQLKTLKKYLNE